MSVDCTASRVARLGLVPAGSECNWEWERTWKLLALGRKRDTTPRTLSLRHTARAGSALLGRPGRLDCFAFDRRAGLLGLDSCLVVARLGESTACLLEIQIDLTSRDAVCAVVAVVVVDDDEIVAVHHYCSILAQEAAAAFRDRSSQTFRTRIDCISMSWDTVIANPSK